MKNLFGDGKVREGKEGSKEGEREESLSAPTYVYL